MARPLRELFAEFSLKIKNLQQLVKTNEELDKTAKKSKKADKSLQGLTDAFRGLGSIIAASVGIDAMLGFAQATLESTNELMRWSNRLQISITELKGLTSISAQYGIKTEDVADAIKELQLKAQDAISGGKEQAEMYKRIGISLDDLKPVVNDAGKLFNLFQEKISKVNDEGLRNFTVDELMSDAGTRMLPIFRMNSKELEKHRKIAEKRARRTEKLARIQSKFNRTISESRLEFEALMTEGLIKVLPLIIKISDKGGKMAKSLSELAEKSNIFKAALIALAGIAGVFAIATIGIWGPILLGAAAIAFIVLAIDDLITAFQGGKSLIRDFLDAIGMLFDIGPIGSQFFDGLREGLKLISAHMDRGKTFTEALQRAVSHLWDSGDKGRKFVATIGSIIGIAIDLFSSFSSFLTETWWPILGGVFDAVIGAIQSVVSAISGLSNIGNTLSNIPLIGGLFGGNTGTTGTTGTTTTPTNTGTAIAQNTTQNRANINAGVSVNIGSINEATDINRVRREISTASREATDRQVRRLQGALVQS